MKIRVLFFVVGLTFIVSGCGQQTTNSNSVQNGTVADNTNNTTQPIATTQDCGMDAACFEAKFKACHSAKITYNINEQITQSYEILGVKDGRCELKTMFPKNILPDLMNKEGYCLYNNKVSFPEASQEIIALGTNFGTYCHGPLYDAIKDMGAGR